jgi:hypothetical protein
MVETAQLELPREATLKQGPFAEPKGSGRGLLGCFPRNGDGPDVERGYSSSRGGSFVSK